VIAVAVDLSRFVLGSLLVAAGIAKLSDHGRFRVTLSTIGWLGGRSIAAAAVTIPVLELAAGLLLVVAPIAGAAFAVALLLLFSLVAEVLHRRDVHVRCSCFGAFGEDRLGRGTIARNAALVALALPVLAAPPPLGAESVPLALTAAAITTTAGLLAAVRSQIGMPRDELLAAGAARARRAEEEPARP
jgi:hypothetical protein